MYTVESAETDHAAGLAAATPQGSGYYFNRMKQLIDRREVLDALTDGIIGAAAEVHRVLGPGLLESAYQACLCVELAERYGFRIEQQKPLPMIYRGKKLGCGHRIDLAVNELVLVEVRTVDRLMPLHEAQMLAYLKLSGCAVGLLINFNVRTLKDGVRRVVNNY